MRLCVVCRTEKPVSAFKHIRAGVYRSRCKACSTSRYCRNSDHPMRCRCHLGGGLAAQVPPYLDREIEMD